MKAPKVPLPHQVNKSGRSYLEFTCIHCGKRLHDKDISKRCKARKR